MIKIGLIVIYCFLTNFIFAQITIRDGDMPMVNNTFSLSTTTDILDLDPELTGLNYSWDFSTLVPQSQRIDTFFSVSATPFVYQLFFSNIFLYPNHKASYAIRGQDLGVPQVSISEVYTYFKNSTSAFDNVGFGSTINGIPSSTQNNPVDRVYQFPMIYGASHSSNSEFEISVPSFGHYGQTLDRAVTIDGWGSLTLPNGTFNVLRVKSILNKVDTTYFDLLVFGTTITRPEEIEYKWMGNSKGVPLLKIITNAGVVTQIEYQDDPLFVQVVTENKKMEQITIFPNPVKNYLGVDFIANTAGNLKVNLKDMLCKEYNLRYSNPIRSGSNIVLIDLTKHAIPPGIYFVTFIINDKKCYTEKIVVVE
jgi:hypothetical protein